MTEQADALAKNLLGQGAVPVETKVTIVKVIEVHGLNLPVLCSPEEFGV
jgi:hypothetical protein